MRKLRRLVVAVPVAAVIAASQSCAGQAGRADPPRAAAAPPPPADAGRKDSPRPPVAPAPVQAASSENVEDTQDSHGAATDRKRAFEADQRACEQKQLAACRALGAYYLKGSPGVVEQNPAKAAQILDQACKAGHAASCFDLATLYEEGKGVKRNPKKAARLRTKAEVFEGVE